MIPGSVRTGGAAAAQFRSHKKDVEALWQLVEMNVAPWF
jgi:hypothetical protein